MGKTCGWGYCTILGSSSRLRCKGPKDLPLAKTFGIWLQEDDGLSISDTLTLVSRCNAKISCTDLETKHSAKWNEGVLHLVSVQEPSLTTLKELNYNPYAGYRRVQFQKKKSAKQFQNLETSSRSPKVMRTCEAIMILLSLALQQIQRSRRLLVVEVRDFLCSIEVAISALLRIKCYTWVHLSYR